MRFRPALFGFGPPVLLFVMAVAIGQQRPAATNQNQNNQPVQPANKGLNKTVEQNFPPNGVMETAWKIEWDTQRGNGLVIKNAWYKRGPQIDWMQVLGDCRVAELFVPYHRGSPRFWDVTQYNFPLTTVTAADAGANGKLHYSNNGFGVVPCVVEELKERGVIWKGYNGVRRGHSLVLWGCLEAANYRYIIEYGFQDDGCVTFRCGATGHNLGGAEFEPHMHNNLWRLDVNLDDKDHNTVLLMERIEPLDEKVKAQSRHTNFNDGKEGGADFDANKFTMLRVISTEKKNIRGQSYSYDLMPSRVGNSRHFKDGEECTQHDFWVTKANPKEVKYRDVHKYCNEESIEDTDIVIWYSAPMHHEPRSEDGIMMNNQLVGCTHVGWSSFTLRPSNIFDRTPLFPYDTVGAGKAKGKGKGKGGIDD